MTQRAINKKLRELKIYLKYIEEHKKDTENRIKRLKEFIKETK